MYVNRFDENTTTRPLIRKLFLAIAAAVLVVPLALSGCGAQAQSAGSSSASTDTGAGPITTKEKGPITKEDIEKIVARKIGDVDETGAPILRQLTLTPGANGTNVTLDMSPTEACHKGQLVAKATSMAQQVMSAAFRYSDVGQVELSLFGTTDNPEDRDKMAVRLMVTKEKATGLDWFQFTDKNVEQLASEFWAEPLVYANWKIYGGAAITDESLRAQANSGATP